MKNEREQDLTNQEPIRVSLGQDFAPFRDIKTLDELGTGEGLEDSFASEPFYVEGIGHGRAALKVVGLTTTDGWFILGNSNLLNFSNESVQLTKLEYPLAYIAASINEFSGTIKTQPDIICTVKAGDLELRAKNLFLKEDLENGAWFDSFSTKENPTSEDFVIINASPQNLKRLVFRFDPNLDSSTHPA
ncbi:MAG: hypothetical protein A2687_02815 [Candidatus Levybacteria bacterium RIFCSPHIGHO2_01_FULL_38_26]|nr:MAG: hypothetical protein A2687_02815 [Candidatus Levybacteria bacterium RIFCSPHIGHO2_01_FULL_38_26]